MRIIAVGVAMAGAQAERARPLAVAGAASASTVASATAPALTGEMVRRTSRRSTDCSSRIAVPAVHVTSAFVGGPDPVLRSSRLRQIAEFPLRPDPRRALPTNALATP